MHIQQHLKLVKVSNNLRGSQNDQTCNKIISWKINLKNSGTINIQIENKNQESLIWFSIEYELLVQDSFPATWETAITRRLREPTAKEIVLIALAFLEFFLLISKKLDVIRIWLLSKHKRVSIDT